MSVKFQGTEPSPAGREVEIGSGKENHGMELPNPFIELNMEYGNH